MSESIVHLRVPTETKTRWVRASQAQSQKLTEWVVGNVELGSQNTLATAKSMLAFSKTPPFHGIMPADLEAVRASALVMLRALAMSSETGWGEACFILSHELTEEPEEGGDWMTGDARFFFARAAALGYPDAVESLQYADEKTLVVVDELRRQYEFNGI